MAFSSWDAKCFRTYRKMLVFGQKLPPDRSPTWKIFDVRLAMNY